MAKPQEMHFEFWRLGLLAFRLTFKRAFYAACYGHGAGLRMQQEFEDMLLMGGEL